MSEAQARRRWREAVAAVNRFTSLPNPDDGTDREGWETWIDQGEAAFVELHAARILLNEARASRTGEDALRDAGEGKET